MGLSSPLWALAWLAARLAMTGHLPRMGRCANDKCGWLFLDTSRGGARASQPSREAGR